VEIHIIYFSWFLYYLFSLKSVRSRLLLVCSGCISILKLEAVIWIYTSPLHGATSQKLLPLILNVAYGIAFRVRDQVSYKRKGKFTILHLIWTNIRNPGRLISALYWPTGLPLSTHTNVAFTPLYHAPDKANYLKTRPWRSLEMQTAYKVHVPSVLWRQ
jgi:hypothetical protein